MDLNLQLTLNDDRINIFFSIVNESLQIIFNNDRINIIDKYH